MPSSTNDTYAKPSANKGVIRSSSAATTRDELWSLEDSGGNVRADLGTVISQEHTIPVPLDKHGKAGNFGLYYFRVWKGPSDAIPPSTIFVLFCAGGPGEIPIQEDREKFLGIFLRETENISVVYFHQRGSGLSQVPRKKGYDAYLRSRFVLDDIEAIRHHIEEEAKTRHPDTWHGKNLQWDAVFGHSYGSMIAYQYAAHKTYGNDVKHVILSQPISRHQFANLPTSALQSNTPIPAAKVNAAFNTFNDNRNKRLNHTLETIYHVHPRFHRLKQCPSTMTTILAHVAEARHAIVQRFRQTSRLLAQYNEISDLRRVDKRFTNLKGKAFNKEFFIALQALKTTGWLPTPNTRRLQEDIGLVVGAEVLGDDLAFARIARFHRKSSEMPLIIDFARRSFLGQKDLSSKVGKASRKFSRLIKDGRDPWEVRDEFQNIRNPMQAVLGLCPGPNLHQLRQRYKRSSRSMRAYYVFGAYDGAHARFLVELLKTTQQPPRDVRNAMLRSHGTHDRNHLLAKMTVNDELPIAWDPQSLTLRQRTFIITGGADPVTANGEAQAIEKAIGGKATWISIPGVGHGLQDVRTDRILTGLLVGFLRGDVISRQRLKSQIKRFLEKILKTYGDNEFDSENSDPWPAGENQYKPDRQAYEEDLRMRWKKVLVVN